MTPIDLLICARWIIPINPAGRVFEDCALAVDKGVIIAITPQEEATKRYQAKHTYQLDEHVIMPGLINAHGHAAMSLLRGFADDKPLQDWLTQDIWPTEKQFVDEDFVHTGTELAMAEMIRSGTTCFADMYFFPEQTALAATEAKMRCQLHFPILEFPTNWGSGPDDYLSKGIRLHDQVRANPLVTVGFGPHAPYTVSDETFKKISMLAQEMDMPIHVHLHETQQEVHDSITQYGVRPTQRLMDLGILLPQTQCVHMTQIEPIDIEILQQSGAHVIHCPESNLKLASGFCPVGQLQSTGINIALGTDGAASSNSLSLFTSLRLASLLAKGVSNNATCMDAHSSLRMATINGAKALGIDEQVGSLEVGKQADIIAIQLSDLAQEPVYNPVSPLVYTDVSTAVTHNWVAGKCLLENRQLLTINELELKHKIQRIKHTITSA